MLGGSAFGLGAGLRCRAHSGEGRQDAATTRPTLNTQRPPKPTRNGDRRRRTQLDNVLLKSDPLQPRGYVAKLGDMGLAKVGRVEGGVG